MLAVTQTHNTHARRVARGGQSGMTQVFILSPQCTRAYCSVEKRFRKREPNGSSLNNACFIQHQQTWERHYTHAQTWITKIWQNILEWHLWFLWRLFGKFMVKCSERFTKQYGCFLWAGSQWISQAFFKAELLLTWRRNMKHNRKRHPSYLYILTIKWK